MSKLVQLKDSEGNVYPIIKGITLYENSNGTNTFPITLSKESEKFSRIDVLFGANHGGNMYKVITFYKGFLQGVLDITIKSPAENVIFTSSKPVKFVGKQFQQLAIGQEYNSYRGTSNISTWSPYIYKIIGYY